MLARSSGVPAPSPRRSRLIRLGEVLETLPEIRQARRRRWAPLDLAGDPAVESFHTRPDGVVVVRLRYDPTLDPGSPAYIQPGPHRPILDDLLPELDGLDEWRERLLGGVR